MNKNKLNTLSKKSLCVLLMSALIVTTFSAMAIKPAYAKPMIDLDAAYAETLISLVVVVIDSNYPNPFWSLGGHADVTYYPNYEDSGIDYIGVSMHIFTWGTWGGGILRFALGREFTVVDTDIGSVSSGDTYCWWPGAFPSYGTATVCEAFKTDYYYLWEQTFYIVAQRTDYSSDSCWIQLEGVVVTVASEHDWESIALA
jgi:hypothetical protein